MLRQREKTAGVEVTPLLPQARDWLIVGHSSWPINNKYTARINNKCETPKIHSMCDIAKLKSNFYKISKMYVSVA